MNGQPYSQPWNSVAVYVLRVCVDLVVFCGRRVVLFQRRSLVLFKYAVNTCVYYGSDKLLVALSQCCDRVSGCDHYVLNVSYAYGIYVFGKKFQILINHLRIMSIYNGSTVLVFEK